MADASFEVELRVTLNDGNLNASLSRSLDTLKGRYAGLDSEINKAQRSLDATSGAFNRQSQNASTMRYALYDVASTFTILGAAALGAAGAVTAVAVAWEKDFAQVIRTTGVVGDEVTQLRDNLVDLAQTMPVAFGDITKVATLAGQLGVAKENVAAFTETVIKFSAASNVSVEDAATAFGRLDALLPDVRGNYEALGSAIALVGVNSVATESEIIKIATQLSSVTNIAGFTADQVVGLSGALATVGAPPELSRGTITRLFTQMNKAVSEGGDSLEAFARISGVSSQEFTAAWGTEKFAPIFESFIRNLQNTEKTGGDALKALKELGITSVRDVPLLLRLSEASDKLGESFDNAAKGFREASELQRQYSIISETTAAKLQILANNFLALMDAIGSANLGPIKNILDALSGFLGMLTDIASNDVGAKILGWVTVFVAVAGVVGLAAGALALFGASTLAMRQGLEAIVAVAPRASAVILGTGTASAIASGEMSAAAAAAGLFWKALKAISIIGLLLVLPDLAQTITGWARAIRGVDESLTATIGRVEIGISEFVDNSLDQFGTFGAAVNRALAGFDAGILGDIKKVDEGLRDMVNSGQVDAARMQFEALKKQWLDSGKALSTFLTYFPDTHNALRAATLAANDQNYAMARGREELDLNAAAMQVAEEHAEALATALGLTTGELETLQGNVQEGSAAFFDWSGNVKAAYEEGGGGITAFIAKLDEQIAAQQSWAEDMQILSSRGALAFVSELAKMGPEGAALAADAVNLTQEELMKLEEKARLAAFLASAAFAEEFVNNTPLLIEAYRAGGLEAVQALIEAQVSGAPGAVEEVIDAYNIALEGNPMSIQAETFNADGELQRFVNRMNEATGTSHIQAEPTAADRELTLFKNRMDAAQGTSHVHAEPSNADRTLGGFVTRMNTSRGTSSIFASPWNANAELAHFLYRVNSSSGRSTIYASAWNADNELTRFLNRVNSSSATTTVYVRRIGYGDSFATGGYIAGPGTGTSDSIPAWLSNGEYVMRAAAVAKYGTGFMNAVNSMRAPRFASGGPVGPVASTASQTPMGSVVELGPKSLSRLAREVSVNVLLDDVAISRASESGDKKRRFAGELK